MRTASGRISLTSSAIRSPCCTSSWATRCFKSETTLRSGRSSTRRSSAMLFRPTPADETACGDGEPLEDDSGEVLMPVNLRGDWVERAQRRPGVLLHRRQCPVGGPWTTPGYARRGGNTRSVPRRHSTPPSACSDEEALSPPGPVHPGPMLLAKMRCHLFEERREVAAVGGIVAELADRLFDHGRQLGVLVGELLV